MKGVRFLWSLYVRGRVVAVVLFLILPLKLENYCEDQVEDFSVPFATDEERPNLVFLRRVVVPEVYYGTTPCVLLFTSAMSAPGSVPSVALFL